MENQYKYIEEQPKYLEHHAELGELIVSVPFFAGLPEDSLQKINTHFVTLSHPPNQIILLENDWGGSVYFILEGWVKIRTYNLDGKEVTLNIIGQGEIFGEMAALDKMPRSTDAITLTPTIIGRIPSQKFVDLITTEPLAGVRLAQLMAKRLRQVNRRLQLREANSTSRVADAILFLVEGQGQIGETGTAIPNLPHREISSLSGLARETVTRVLTKLEKRGIIKRDADLLTIPDLPALENMIL
ncbi:transcriptional regulator, Crp/Fnr family [Stanieria cyanosphaera PCC 7437]|uniref:Transcriptional regulator, Crp/Fnr family n=1 Tax=Stanieria cyanosphaera (strain ATCC 29371 / PCC 7437) TaxID=111780 RepID=K9XNQ3_STAC7|nr:Crp/Fnr family transcriptional regulator [Stanieria cyanosphaera]AFZ34240.1 transcriptional regulator, Crp/Fnr family [Stanieria cyanosphaera PCC 7437]